MFVSPSVALVSEMECTVLTYDEIWLDLVRQEGYFVINMTGASAHCVRVGSHLYGSFSVHRKLTRKQFGQQSVTEGGESLVLNHP